MTRTSIALATVALITQLGCSSPFSVKFGGQPTTRGSGNVTTEERVVADFAQIVSSGAADLLIEPGDYSLIITTDDNIQPLITSRVENGKLLLGSEGSYSTNRGVSIKVTMPDLQSAKSNGSGDITFAEFAGDTLVVKSSGSGNVRFSGTNYQKMEVVLQGSGSVEGSGQTNSISTTISGSGNVDLTELSTPSADARVSGSGSISISPTENLIAKVNGSGNINYRKHDRLTVEKQVTGSGRVRAR